MSRKKLVIAAHGRAVHRACRSSAGRATPGSVVPSGIVRAPKDISRAELLRRIEALRKTDAETKSAAGKGTPRAAKRTPAVGKAKPAVGKGGTAVGKGKRAAGRRNPGVAKRQAVGRSRASAGDRPGRPVVPPPQPYYGVEMKFIDGRWVQMHPDSE